MLLLFLKASRKKKALTLLLIIVLVATSFAYNIQSAKAGALTTASNKITNSTPSAVNVQYVTQWTFPSTDTIRCMQIQYTTTASGSTIPTGMTTTSASKLSISGGGLTDGSWTGYYTTNGTLQYENSTGQASTATPVTITTNGITNPSSTGVYYAQIRTYSGLATHACSGEVDHVTVAFAVTAGQALSVDVDPSLSFAVSNLANGITINGASTTVNISAANVNTIPLGHINSSANVIVGQSLTVQTNAVNGYTVYASYSGTLSDGAGTPHTIADHTGTNGTPTSFPSAGTSAFGYTTSSTTLSGTGTRFQSNKWAKFETWGYEVAKKTTKTSGDDVTNVGIQVGVSGSQEAGTYTTTIIYVATPTY